MKKRAETKSGRERPVSLDELAKKKARKKGRREAWELRLYVAGQTPRSLAAFSNLKKICEEHLPGRYNIEVVDLVKHPQLAAGDQIVAIPTLVTEAARAGSQNRGGSSRYRAFVGRVAIAPGQTLTLIGISSLEYPDEERHP
jgi:hypothetical protein